MGVQASCRPSVTSPSAYVGMLGLKRRGEKLILELLGEGCKFDEEELSRVYTPVGLDIGGDVPEEIALSIVAEVRAVLARRGGGHLRDRTSPIHAEREDVRPVLHPESAAATAVVA